MSRIGQVACQGFLVREACVHVLVVIYHVALPAECLPAFSFCLGCCVWGGLSAGWKFVVLLTVEVPPCGSGWMSGLSRFPC